MDSSKLKLKTAVACEDKSLFSKQRSNLSRRRRDFDELEASKACRKVDDNKTVSKVGGSCSYEYASYSENTARQEAIDCTRMRTGARLAKRLSCTRKARVITRQNPNEAIKTGGCMRGQRDDLADPGPLNDEPNEVEEEPNGGHEAGGVGGGDEGGDGGDEEGDEEEVEGDEEEEEEVEGEEEEEVEGGEEEEEKVEGEEEEEVEGVGAVGGGDEEEEEGARGEVSRKIVTQRDLSGRLRLPQGMEINITFRHLINNERSRRARVEIHPGTSVGGPELQLHDVSLNLRRRKSNGRLICRQVSGRSMMDFFDIGLGDRLIFEPFRRNDFTLEIRRHEDIEDEEDDEESEDVESEEEDEDGDAHEWDWSEQDDVDDVDDNNLSNSENDNNEENEDVTDDEDDDDE